MEGLCKQFGIHIGKTYYSEVKTNWGPFIVQIEVFGLNFKARQKKPLVQFTNANSLARRKHLNYEMPLEQFKAQFMLVK
jgi:hypothetical protein